MDHHVNHLTVGVDGAAIQGNFLGKLRSHVHGRPWIVDYLNKECRWLLQKDVRARSKLMTTYLV